MTILRIVGYALLTAGVLVACLYAAPILFFYFVIEGRF